MGMLEIQAQKKGIKWLTSFGKMHQSDGYVSFNHSQSGQIVAKLAERQMTIGDVPVSAAALLARGQAPVAAASIAAPAAQGTDQTAQSAAPAPSATRAARRDPAGSAAAAVPSRAPAPLPSAVPAPVPPASAAPTPAASPQSSTVSQ